jgi:hypothetical protein
MMKKRIISAVLFVIILSIHAGAVQTVLYHGPFKLATHRSNTFLGCCDNTVKCCDSIPQNWKSPVDYTTGKIMIELDVRTCANPNNDTYYIRFILGIRSPNQEQITSNSERCYHSIWESMAPRWKDVGVYKWEAKIGGSLSPGATDFFRERKCKNEDFALGIFAMIFQFKVNGSDGKAPGEISGITKITLVSGDDPAMTGSVTLKHNDSSWKNNSFYRCMTSASGELTVLSEAGTISSVDVFDSKGQQLVRYANGNDKTALLPHSASFAPGAYTVRINGSESAQWVKGR